MIIAGAFLVAKEERFRSNRDNFTHVDKGT